MVVEQLLDEEPRSNILATGMQGEDGVLVVSTFSRSPIEGKLKINVMTSQINSHRVCSKKFQALQCNNSKCDINVLISKYSINLSNPIREIYHWTAM